MIFYVASRKSPSPLGGIQGEGEEQITSLMNCKSGMGPNPNNRREHYEKTSLKPANL